MQQTVLLSTPALIKYTLLSFIFAAAVLLIIILPAEYNIDPTGLGEKLGLTVFTQTSTNAINTNLKQPVQNATNKPPVTIEVIVPAGRGVEYKFVMTQYQKLNYEWQTNGSLLYFDLHGEPKGDTTGYFESYAIATLETMKGSFTAPFSGSHGWYWKNTTDKPVIVTLIVEGQYISHRLK
ncbi:hypothetical protein KO525_18205 [Psychrosphaera sp. B3R10]|uniref:Transmembrane anchor protein n=1 Tax=Psychrosphaera algicola TaxID=3023714 RepID=A0ABT5FHA4_9GAMM|nr:MULTISPECIES: hypothetical protein [unclassified Psychrosphaera]MBU2882921.1 hypothetical protein [Psychrosphaera sp. I2R16]MBU2991318.1 hypothetical protein [Psychrosphaera sp. B3R10]MDC2890565.1 hypothetical protein [Psychrosphaera sp. G1-22]MDO6720207.1 hypothetical protein [Psychrosphaera sp. 1_MG-2023]